MGRMQVGRFADRAQALDHLVAKYSTERVGARYTLHDESTARVVFSFERTFPNGKRGIVQYVGNGVDLSDAIQDLFGQLGEPVDGEGAVS